MEINPINKFKYRKVLAKKICEYLDEIETTDILQEFEDSKEVQELVKRMGGDVDTNIEIEKFDRQAEELIKMTIHNLKKQVKDMLPFYILNTKFVKSKEDEGGEK